MFVFSIPSVVIGTLYIKTTPLLSVTSDSLFLGELEVLNLLQTIIHPLETPEFVILEQRGQFYNVDSNFFIRLLITCVKFKSLINKGGQSTSR